MPEAKRITQTKVSCELLDCLPITVHKMIEDDNDGQGICAIGEYDQYEEFDGTTTSDKERGMYTAFWSNRDTVHAFLTTDDDNLQMDIERINAINKHLKVVKVETGQHGLDFVRDKVTVKITYSR